MWIGLISDTHDNIPLLKKAITKLNKEKVELVLHSGDYVAPFVIPLFKDLRTRLIGVFGNNDGDISHLKKCFDEFEACESRGRFAEILVGNFKIGLLHGDETELLNSLINSQSFDAIVYGHTHKSKVERKGVTLVVNPGEVCGYLSGRSTLVLLDSERAQARVIEL